MGELTLPIFVVEGNDVVIFTSLKDVQIQLEPIDIANNAYISYDAKGRLLKIKTDGKHIEVFPMEEVSSHSAELETVLRKYLVAMNEPTAKEKACDLPCLVNLSMKYAFGT